MTITDKDHFVLLKKISGIKEQVGKISIYGNHDMKDMRNEFDGMIERLIDVVNELHKKEELTEVKTNGQ